MAAPGRAVFFLQHGSFEPAFQTATLGLTAAALGDEVYFVFAWDALRQLVRGTFGQPHSEREMSESARAEGLGASPPAKMLQNARSLGAQVIAVDTVVRVCGFLPEELPSSLLDRVVGGPELWRLTEGARVLSF